MSAVGTRVPARKSNHQQRRRVRTAAVAAVVGAVTLAACSAGNTGTNNASGPGSGGAAGGASGKALTFSPCCSWGTTWSYNPYNVNGLGIQNDFITLRLAIAKSPSLTDFYPQLSDKWSTTDSTVTVHLREDAKWQDGKPVTSTDLVDTAYLDGTRGDSFWSDITTVKATDTHTVTYTLKKGEPAALALYDILANTFVYPSSVYGSLVTPQLKADEDAYWPAYQKSSAQAGKMPEYGRIQAAFQKLAALKVPKLIGDGPFQLDNITTKEAKLTKWNDYFGASQIKLSGINYQDGSNQTIYPQLFSSSIDFSNVYLSPPLLKRWQSTPNSQLALPQAFGFVLGFNSSKYPLNITAVRQALAYVIPRQQMTEASYGSVKDAGGVYQQIPTGISPTLQKLYLTDAQLGQLNPYNVDPDKATQLLTSAGFTKKNGQWYEPNGKQFTLSFTVNADTSDVVTSFTSAASALSAFGIKSQVNATPGAQQTADQHNGNFDIGMWFIGDDNPLLDYADMLGPSNNFTTLGNYAGKRGMGFGPTANVPGLGTVDVSSTINNQARNTPPGDAMKAATWNWAQLVNQQVPYIWYATKVYQFSYSNKNITNWPPVDASTGTSDIWNVIGANMTAGVSYAIQQGYLAPK